MNEQEVLAIIEAREKKEQERKNGLFEGMTLPLTEEQFHTLDYSKRQELRRLTHNWRTKVKGLEGRHLASESERIAAALGTTPCPTCSEDLWLDCKDFGLDTGYWERSKTRCCCYRFRLIQDDFNQIVGWRYRAMDFRTAKPSTRCFLPLEQQEKNWDEARANINSNFFLAGSAGSGKTTLAVMIAREALWRHIDKKEKYHPKTPWVWVVDADELFRQHTEWSTTRTSETPAEEPIVTPRKIAYVKSLGYTPTLVLEELDKGKLTESRFDFLFAVVNAMDKEQGQMVITTNRELPRFMAMFTESQYETIRTSGEPMMRRFFDNNCIMQSTFKE